MLLLQYSVVARGSTALCSHRAEGEVDYDMIMQSVLPNIPTSLDQRTSYTSRNNVTLNVVIENGLIFLCACDSTGSQNKAFAFLNEIKKLFTSSNLVHRAQYANEYELNRDFEPVLANQMERYSFGAGDQMSNLQSQVNEVKDVMTQNIEKVLERGQRLEDLMDRTNELEASASTFHTTARHVQRHMCWKSTKMTIILVVVSILVIGVIIVGVLFATHVLPPSGGAPTPTIPPTTTHSSVNGI